MTVVYHSMAPIFLTMHPLLAAMIQVVSLYQIMRLKGMKLTVCMMMTMGLLTSCLMLMMIRLVLGPHPLIVLATMIMELNLLQEWAMERTAQNWKTTWYAQLMSLNTKVYTQKTQVKRNTVLTIKLSKTGSSVLLKNGTILHGKKHLVRKFKFYCTRTETLIPNYLQSVFFSG